MKQTVTFSDFHDAFRAHDRLTGWSYPGLYVLFEYLEQYEEDTGEEIELDVVALCCDYNEADPEDIASNYGIDTSEALDEEGDIDFERFNKIVNEYLVNNTYVCGTTPTGAIVYQVF